MVSLRINASSSSRGDVRQARCKTNKAARFPASSAYAVELQEESLKVERIYIHLHRYKQTNMFSAWFKDCRDTSKSGKKVERIFFGSHLTAYLAARLTCKPLKHLAPRFVTEFKTPGTTASNKLQYKLQKMENFSIAGNKLQYNREPSQPASFPAEVEETKSGEHASAFSSWCQLQHCRSRHSLCDQLQAPDTVLETPPRDFV